MKHAATPEEVAQAIALVNGSGQQPNPNRSGSGHHASDDATTQTAENVEIKRLAGLSIVHYERERTKAAKLLGLRASILDRLVTAERLHDDGKQGRAIALPEPVPCEETVAGEQLLDDLAVGIRSYVVMSDATADACALWCVHSHLVNVSLISPRLAISSPEKGCGKTTLLDVLARLVWRPLPTANTTASAIFRVIELQQPTLLIDEGDTFLTDNEELRGILNSGHRRGGAVLRVEGDAHEPRQFSTYSACAVALIGKLPGTLADRSIPIELKRRRQDEKITPFRWDSTEELDLLARRIARWTRDNGEKLRQADPGCPAGITNRAADNWRPLLSIADAAGPRWARRARAAAQILCAQRGNDDSARVLLLSDIYDVFVARNTDFITSADLVTALVAVEGRPWPEWKRGKPLSVAQLARLLGPFGGIPVRDPAGQSRGYRLVDLNDAFQRYLPPPGTAKYQSVRNSIEPGLLDTSEVSESIPF